MSATQKQIEKLRTLQESYDELANKVAELDGVAKEDSVKELSQFFGLPAALPETYEFMTPEEVCAELEEIMTSMDLGLTQEQAKEITNNTLNKG